MDFILHVKKTFFPDCEPHIVNQGDEVDQHSLGKYAANPNGRSGGDEVEEAKHRLRPWFKEFPNTFVCTSNHTYRVYKRAFNIGIPDQFLRSVWEVYGAPPGWKWADRWNIGDICFEHGENVSGPMAALLAATQNRMSTSIGHQHSFGGVVWSGSPFQNVFGLNTGCLIDIDAYAFQYGKTLRKKPTLGCGVIKNGIPYFVPMILGINKRWVKRI